MLPTPGFHHLHLRAIDPAAAIGFYTRQFPTPQLGHGAASRLFCHPITR